jgi:hypothetical protein
MPDLDRCCSGQSSLVVAAATVGRWDIVKMLLEFGEEAVSVAPLLSSNAFEIAPRSCQEVVHLHAAFPSRASSLKEYFERQISGEVMSSALLPAT